MVSIPKKVSQHVQRVFRPVSPCAVTQNVWYVRVIFFIAGSLPAKMLKDYRNFVTVWYYDIVRFISFVKGVV
jgi:hypothetical protein